MKKKLSATKGFSLIETMIYVVLLVIMVTVFTAFSVDVVRAGVRVVDKKIVDQNNRFILSKISQEIKTARQITGVNPTNLALVDADSNNVSFYLESAEQAIYFQNPSQNLRLTGEDVKITNLNFSSVGKGVKIEFSLERAKPASSLYKPYQLTTTQLILPRQNIY